MSTFRPTRQVKFLIEVNSNVMDVTQEGSRFRLLRQLFHVLRASYSSSLASANRLVIGISNKQHQCYDFVCCGKAGVMLTSFTSLLRDGDRKQWSGVLRSIAVSQSSAFVVALVVVMDIEEPQLDCLTWLNLICLETRVALLLCWSCEEAVEVLEGLAEAPVDGALGGGRGPQGLGAPIPILIAALTQSPALLSRTDVVRAANKCSTVADLLSMSGDVIIGLPGIGPKKAKRVINVFNAPFPSTEIGLADVVPSVQPPSEASARDAVRLFQEKRGNPVALSSASSVEASNAVVDVDSTEPLLVAAPELKVSSSNIADRLIAEAFANAGAVHHRNSSATPSKHSAAFAEAMKRLRDDEDAEQSIQQQ